MYSSKLFRIVETFTLDEWKGFNRFILGQVGSGAEVTALFKYLYKYKNDLTSNRLEINRAHKALLPNVSRKSFQNVMSKLTRITEDYIRWIWLNSNVHEKDLLLLQAYKDRGLYHLFDLKADRLREDIDKDPVKDIWNDLIQLRINHAQFFSDNPIKTFRGQEMIDNLDNYFALFINNTALYYQTMIADYGKSKNIDFTDKIEKLKSAVVLKNRNALSPILENLLLLFQENEPESFHFLYDIIIRRRIKLNKEITSAILHILLRHARLEFKRGNATTAQMIFSIYDFGMQSGALLIDKKIPSFGFLNAINAASSMNYFEWAGEFIENHQGLLEAKDRNETIALAYAHISFSSDKYDEVIKLLRDIECNKLGSKLRVRWLLLCSYFMEYRNDTEFMSSVLRNYNLFFKNNKNKMRKAIFTSSINLYKIIRSQSKDLSYENLKRDLELNSEVIFRSFLKDLLQKLE